MTINAINGKNYVSGIIHRKGIIDKDIKKVDFGKLLNNAIKKVDDYQKISDNMDELLISGKLDNVHDAMIAAQKSQIVFNFALEIRNQVLDAYKELMRIQL